MAKAGSLSGAGRSLGLSHATVFRRLRDIEQRLGVELFERGRGGYTPTPAGEDAAATAERVEAEVLGVERRVAGQDLRPSGVVRVTTTEALLVGLLSPVFTDFRTLYPEITLEVALSNQLFNLSKREADIALRPSSASPEVLVGRKVGVIAHAVYARRDSRPAPEEAPWVGPDEGLANRRMEAWMAKHGYDARCRYRLDSTVAMRAAVLDGAGLAVLPCYVCHQEPRLVRVGPVIPELDVDLWLVTHPDLRRVARVRAVLDVIADAATRARDRLAGTT